MTCRNTINRYSIIIMNIVVIDEFMNIIRHEYDNDHLKINKQTIKGLISSNQLMDPPTMEATVTRPMLGFDRRGTPRYLHVSAHC